MISAMSPGTSRIRTKITSDAPRSDGMNSRSRPISTCASSCSDERRPGGGCGQALRAPATSSPLRLTSPDPDDTKGAVATEGGGTSAQTFATAVLELPSLKEHTMQGTTRRRFLRSAAVAAGVAGFALDKTPAFAQKRELTFLSWNHF